MTNKVLINKAIARTLRRIEALRQKDRDEMVASLYGHYSMEDEIEREKKILTRLRWRLMLDDQQG